LWNPENSGFFLARPIAKIYGGPGVNLKIQLDKIKFSCYNKALARQKSALILIADLRQKLYHNFWARVKQNKNIYLHDLQGYNTSWVIITHVHQKAKNENV
jgi:hypothetical protein